MRAAAGTKDLADRIERLEMLDWERSTDELNTLGSAVLPDLLSGDECHGVADLYREESVFRSRVVMASHGFGRGEYKYFRYPLPEIIAELKASPESLTFTFKLYRNLDALYDVFESVAESAGAFGSKDEFQALENDVSAFERLRRSVADRMETLAAAKEVEVTRLRTALQTAQANTPSAPPKKIVVDDEAPAKKPVKKKPAPKAAPATTAPSPAAAPPK